MMEVVVVKLFLPVIVIIAALLVFEGIHVAIATIIGWLKNL